MTDIGHNSGDGQEALQRIANDLNSELADSVESIFRKGRLFMQAKKGLGHGQFLRLFANHRDPLPEPVKCSSQQARKYASIAGNDALTNCKSAFHLPCNVDLLYELSRIDEPGLKVAFKEGWITPYIKKKDVKEIRIRLGLDDEKQEKSVNEVASDFLINAKTKARKILEGLPSDKCSGFLFELECIAKELQTEQKLSSSNNVIAE